MSYTGCADYSMFICIRIKNLSSLSLFVEPSPQPQRQRVSVHATETVPDDHPTEHKILGPDHGLEHAKILVGGLTLDRGLVEDTEGIHDALIALVRSSVNP
jgi:hypothetical protein